VNLPIWVQAGETKPAPMPLLLVQAFVNTWDGDRGGADLLLEPASARTWLAEAGLWSRQDPPEPAELHLARTVREGIRALLVTNSGGLPPTPASLQPLQALAQASRPRLEVGSGGLVSISPGPGDRLDAQLASLLLVIRDAQRDGSWQRLKACRNPECLWAFYDRSHSQVGSWCDMSSCGNRIKNRKLRERQVATGSPAG
jgi:predicted RNA-binding Zn ribbon-like protein